VSRAPVHRAVVIGAGGGIGAALVDRLAAGGRFETIHALSRDPPARRWLTVGPGRIDIGDPASIAAAADAIDGPVDLVIVATGLLHDAQGGPERALKQLDAERLAHSFAINAIGPALVLRHFAPLLPREGRSAIACLSARVGSISDNRTGGWYGYRASKAALNQIVRTAAIEIARTHPQALCVALHPGTVDTPLSKPFQRGVPADRLFAPDFAAERLLAVLDGLTPAQSGRCFAWDGQEIAP
jgi:NAD(P)-dependent dehydrogenase (short-subunit alcohol dehydrogenase family)